MTGSRVKPGMTGEGAAGEDEKNGPA